MFVNWLLFILVFMTDVDIEQENAAIAKAYRELLRVSYFTLSNKDKKMIRQAFDVALDAHKTQRRKSGEAVSYTHLRAHET